MCSKACLRLTRAMSGCQSSASRAPQQSSQFEVYGMASCQHASIFLFCAILEGLPAAVKEECTRRVEIHSLLQGVAQRLALPIVSLFKR